MKLGKLQEQFLKGIRSEVSEFDSVINPIRNLSILQCIEIYSRGYVARLTESLGETYEATWWILGDDEFFKLCREYIRDHPSQTFDLSDYGVSFSEFLKERLTQLEIPFISDLAKFELEFKKIFHAPNLVSSAPSGTMVGDDTCFRLSSSASFVESKFPIYSIWKLRGTSLEHLANLNFKNPENLLLFKKDSQVFIHSLRKDESCVVKSLANANTLGGTLNLLLQQFPNTTTERVREIFHFVSQTSILEG